MSDPLAEPIAAVPYVVIDRDGDHHLVGSRSRSMRRHSARPACRLRGVRRE